MGCDHLISRPREQDRERCRLVRRCTGLACAHEAGRSRFACGDRCRQADSSVGPGRPHVGPISWPFLASGARSGQAEGRPVAGRPRCLATTVTGCKPAGALRPGAGERADEAGGRGAGEPRRSLGDQEPRLGDQGIGGGGRDPARRQPPNLVHEGPHLRRDLRRGTVRDGGLDPVQPVRQQARLRRRY